MGEQGKSIVIAGAGASGLMCAWLLANRGYDNITVLEKNDIAAKKLRATGNGRCNFTNKVLSVANYYGDQNIIENMLDAMSTKKAVEIFEKMGIFHTSRDEYIYPYNMRANTFGDIMANACADMGVNIVLNTKIKDIACKDKGYVVKCGENKQYFCDTLILAMGGRAAQSLGGSGTAYKLCKKMGIAVSSIMPGLTGFNTRGLDVKKLAGVRMRAEVNLYSDSKFVKGNIGEVQIVKDGISGIPIFQLSHDAVKSLGEGKKTEVVLDLLPEMGAEKLEEWIGKHPNLRGILHEKWCDVIENEWNHGSIKELVELIKEYRVKLTESFGFERAQVSVGGVECDQVNPETLESKKYKGLYIIGELLDVDGECGGYNLHAAWASAYMCAESI